MPAALLADWDAGLCVAGALEALSTAETVAAWSSVDERAAAPLPAWFLSGEGVACREQAFLLAASLIQLALLLTFHLVLVLLLLITVVIARLGLLLTFLLARLGDCLIAQPTQSKCPEEATAERGKHAAP